MTPGVFIFAAPDAGKLRKGVAYPLADWPADKRKMDYRAIWQGEKRAPRKGEWYFSGSVVEAYKAPNDLQTEYHIAKLVRVKMVQTFEILDDNVVL